MTVEVHSGATTLEELRTEFTTWLRMRGVKCEQLARKENKLRERAALNNQALAYNAAEQYWSDVHLVHGQEREARVTTAKDVFDRRARENVTIPISRGKPET